MPNTQYTSQPLTDWSSEISAPQPGAHAHTTTSTTTTTTSSASVGSQGGAAPVTTTVTDTDVGVPAAQRPQPYSAQAAAPSYSAPAARQAPPPSAQQSQARPAQTGAPLYSAPAFPQAQSYPAPNEFTGSVGTLDLQTHQPIEVIEAPASMNEAFLGSLKSMLLRNRGNFITATFLIGTQGTTAWEGILHDVGNDYVVIYQPGRARYIACDIYALKYIEFYDTRRQEMCENLMRQNGWRNQY